MELGATTIGSRARLLGSGGRRAFTLVELMVVIVIAAITAAIILPELRGTFEEALLRSTARKLTDACYSASSRAIARNESQQLRLDTRTGRYVIEAHDGEASPDGGEGGASRAPSRVEGQLDARITIEIGGARPEAEDRGTETATPSEPSASHAGGARDEPFGRETPPETFVFHSDGTASGPSIVLRDREGFRMGFVVHPVTARVRLTELPRR